MKLGRFIFIVAVVLARLLGRVWPGRSREDHFAHYYAASRLVLAGRNLYTPSLGPVCRKLGLQYESDVPVPTNPPTQLWRFAPRAILPVRVAFGVGGWRKPVLWWRRCAGGLPARVCWLVRL